MDNVRVNSLKRKIEKKETKQNTNFKEVKKPDLYKFKFDYFYESKTYSNLLAKYTNYFEQIVANEAIINEKLIMDMTDQEVENLFNTVLHREISNCMSFEDVSDIRNEDGRKLDINTIASLCKINPSEVCAKDITIAYNDGYVNLICVLNQKTPKSIIKSRWNFSKGMNIAASIGYILAYLYLIKVTDRKLSELLKESNSKSKKGDYAIKEYNQEQINALFNWADYGYYFLYPIRIKGLSLILEAFSIIAEEQYNAKLDEEYNKMLKKSYATSYIQKKNIPKKVLDRMNNSVFLKDFSELELDQETDLSKFSLIEEEYSILKDKIDLSKLFSSKTKPALRFRKLGKHRALGLYFPFCNCVCVDLNAPSSFFHEIGHCIDYTFTDDTLKLSSKSSFRSIVANYRKLFLKEVDDLDDSHPSKAYLKYKKSYYFNTSEIFARTWEMYLILIKKLESSFAKPKLSIDRGYPTTTEHFLNIIKIYFDELLNKMSLNLEVGISTFINPNSNSVTPLLQIVNSNSNSSEKDNNKNLSISDSSYPMKIADSNGINPNNNLKTDRDIDCNISNFKIKINKGTNQLSFL
ncbi:hypothetical protein HMPREF1092_03225 [Clostridium thermobutyricum]|uniref:Uncharacterized protein n=1 Tax=Clostridium thermobutyricum TaxID=29372 RepID=N9W9B1_9CLOT|nr:hypothetical protein [Clostridium thermobutyricum]ENY99484.1 hypothetical protein HMPREF1092_03225 [Clostridium thermobutyricum]